MKINLFIFLLFIPFFSIGQKFYSKNISQKDGLPQHSVRFMLKDSRGYYWIGTDGGLSKWDGIKFTYYNTLDGLAGNKVWWIEEDQKGNLWMACFGGGITQFNGQKFESYTAAEGLVDNSVRVIKSSQINNALLISTGYGISVFTDDQFYNYYKYIKDSTQSRFIGTGILENDSESILYDYLYKHKKVIWENGNPQTQPIYIEDISDTGVSSINVFSNNDTVIGIGRYGFLLKNNSKRKRIYHIGQIFGSAYDEFGTLWLASWNNSDHYKIKAGIYSFKKDRINDEMENYQIISNEGWLMHYDSLQNNIFFGTIDKGLYKIPPQIFKKYNAEKLHTSTAVKAIQFDDSNQLWGITDSLLFQITDDHIQYRHIDVVYQKRLDELKSLKSNKYIEKQLDDIKNRGNIYTALDIDQNKTIWIGTSRLGLFSVKDQAFESFYLYDTIRDIHNRSFVIRHDTIFATNDWALEFNVIPLISSKRKVFRYQSSEPLNSIDILSYKNEKWMYSRISGVFMFKNDSIYNLCDADSSLNKVIHDVCFDSIGNAYLAGNDGRIEILEPKSRKKINEIKLEDVKTSLEWIEISGSYLYAGYGDGLRIFPMDSIHSEEPVYYLYQEAEGYNPETVHCSELDKENNIWLGTSDGLLKINTALFEKIDCKPLLSKIKKVEIFNRDTDWSSYGEIDNWSKLPKNTPYLKPEENNLTIHYLTLNYQDPNKERYYYQLDGIDKDWIGPTDKTSVTYPYLNPGHYIFKVKSKNLNTNLFSNEATFSFIILTPWYQQWWFIISAIIFLIGVLYLFYRSRINRIKKEDQRKRNVMAKISDLENQALQAQMNPHFLFNSLNSIQSFILKNNVDDALLYLNAFSRVIRLTLEFSNKKFIPLSDELEYLKNYTALENMRFDELFEFNIIIDSLVDIDDLQIPPMITQIIIENSIKHGFGQKGHNGKIDFHIKSHSFNSYQIIIIDNGIGREKAKEQQKSTKHNSKGLGLVIERIQNLNQANENLYSVEIIDLYDGAIPSGTKVILTLPLKY